MNQTEIRTDNNYKKPITGMTNTTDEIEKMIQFPCGCAEKMLVYKGTKGKASAKCPRCGKFAIFDYDTMTAIRSGPAKGAVHRLQQGA